MWSIGNFCSKSPRWSHPGISFHTIVFLFQVYCSKVILGIGFYYFLVGWLHLNTKTGKMFEENSSYWPADQYFFKFVSKCMYVARFSRRQYQISKMVMLRLNGLNTKVPYKSSPEHPFQSDVPTAQVQRNMMSTTTTIKLFLSMATTFASKNYNT
jgi:hypothetical protein